MLRNGTVFVPKLKCHQHFRMEWWQFHNSNVPLLLIKNKHILSTSQSSNNRPNKLLFNSRTGITISHFTDPTTQTNTMFSLRFPVPLVNSPSSSSPSPSFHSHSYYPPCHRSQTQGLAITKRGSVAAPARVALRDDAGDGTSLAGESPEPWPEELSPELMPKHVAVIMDGNGRWAKLKGLAPSAGHQAGVESLRRLVRLCCSWGIKVLTVFAFSTDNWVRPKVINVFSYTTRHVLIMCLMWFYWKLHDGGAGGGRFLAETVWKNHKFWNRCF